MAPAIIAFVVMGCFAAVGAYHYWQAHNLTGTKKARDAAIICAVFAGLLFWAALQSTNPTIWWGNGCSVANRRSGVC
jgi:hypothetical protein